jgi:hypothetical protein
MGKPGEDIKVPDEVMAQVFNEGIRDNAEIVASVDKRFVHFIERFRNEMPVTASIRIEKGHHGEYGRGVYFEQGGYRCILAGTVAGRSEEEAWKDTLWTASAEWASFEPVLGKDKVHVEKLWTPYDFTHIFEGGMYDQEYLGASEFRKRQMKRYAAGISKFGQAFEWHSYA